MNQPKGKTEQETGELKRLETLMARVRRSPGEFRTVAAVAAAAELDRQRLEALFRRHVHKGAEAFLEEARVAGARRMLLNHFGPSSNAGETCGFLSQVAFTAQFHRHTGMTPGRYQALGREGASFTLDLPAGYRFEDVLAYHGRDPLSLTEKVEGHTLFKAMRLEDADTLLEMEFKDKAVKVRVRPGEKLDPFLMGRVHHRVVRMLGLGLDPAPFEGFLEADPGFLALVSPRRGLRIPLTADVWEALVWAILGQHVNLAFAYTMRRRLTELCGGALAGGLKTHPTPKAVAELAPDDLVPLQFSRSKAEYLLQAARDVASGELPVEALPAGAATSAEAQLSSRRGIGPWTTHYVMMRGCGFGDCVPLGDAGLTAALQRHFNLDHRPDARETAQLMAPFAPHRSLATFHLWASLKGVPA
jgi:AraC family transcriptional regulator, regulatory protein of adaptative response / DNA-3-methyladenine glycosylase II